MTNRSDSDLVGHFRAGLDVLKRYPILVVPPLAVQVIMVVLLIALAGGVAGMAAMGGMMGGLAGGMAGGLTGLLAAGALLMLLGFMLSLIASGVVIVMAREALAARTPLIGDALEAVMGRLVDVLLASVLLVVIVTIGMLLFVVPGLVAAFFLIFTLPAVLLDGQGAIDGLRRSAAVVKANVGPVVGLIIGGVLAAVVSAVVSWILRLVPLLGHFAAAAVNGVLISYLTVVGVRLYQALPRR